MLSKPRRLTIRNVCMSLALHFCDARGKRARSGLLPKATRFTRRAIVTGVSKWQGQAKCNGLPPKLFEVDPLAQDRQEQARAQALCNECMVARECARDALEHYAGGTIRGGVALPETGGNSPARLKRAAWHYMLLSEVAR